MYNAAYLAPADEFLARWMDQIEESYRRFVEDLVTDPNRMVFTFFHNAEYEGITFSMERKLTKDRMKRERIDIVLEDRRVDGDRRASCRERV